ncbi:bifunctional aspartate kinase/homoserine dehydrogenase I [Rhodohalobacter sp. SW132]|uniref:bifunctional aspartate kinase/homoserine dehydrogenase I n=1 Tax=Rhodohalobacter sp. SW132 TaxID=2293433 RepID=UPI000E268FD9|nr:bifunctional aspartate kinase/homoserine dehydrogenase I [Rhodohalobacter sp. SW132]REL33409.1 bifunctional aspartate kinase/homoserine dehydrogenase I [Rhodohalobacter sp. SW132]
MQVLKFGGSSMGTAESISSVISIVKKRAESGSVAVVVSAMKGVTDQLVETCDRMERASFSYEETIKNLEERHYSVARQMLPAQAQSELITELKLILNELEDVLQGVSLVQEITPKTRDFIMGFGERLSAKLLTYLVKNEGIESSYTDARSFIVTDSRFGNARVDEETTYKKIKNYFNGSGKTKVYVVTGFIAANRAKLPTTLGRGGSDYTASLLGAALKSELIEIWTDVNGLMTADPVKVKRAFPIYEISYEEAMELSHFGAKVIYPPTLIPALKAQIPIVIKNTFDPSQPGTSIRKEIQPTHNLIKGLSSIGNITMLTVKGSGMIGVSGIAARIFTSLADADVNIIMITQASSEHTVSIAVPPNQSETAKNAIQSEFEQEMLGHEIDEVDVEKDLSVIAVVGDNMKNIPGIAGRVFRALGRNGINIRAIAQGSSERNISFVVNNKDEKKAINTLHDAFFLAGVKTVNLYVAGIGLIGGTLLEMIRGQLQVFYDDYNIDFCLRGVANSRQMLIREEGVPLSDWNEQLDNHGKPTSLPEFISQIKQHNLPNSIFVDCTASDEVSEIYPELLSSSISVVTPNKKANSGSLKYYQELHDLASKHNVAFKYETNAGAGLPIISTIDELVSTGDQVDKIEGVLSGTLSYIFNSFTGDQKFSEIVRQAREKGYTEPDPREDLNGRDVARKLLILAREAGFKIEPEDIDVQNLVPEPARNGMDVDQFFEKLSEYDHEFEKMRLEAEEHGKKLCYIARFENGRGVVKLEKISADHPFYGLDGSDNIMALYTRYYKESPMVIKGPGAGANVTSGGIVADILRVVSTKAASNAG